MQLKFHQKVTFILPVSSLRLISEINKQIANAYTKNPKVDHFINKKQAIQVPYWTIFDVITLARSVRF